MRLLITVVLVLAGLSLVTAPAHAEVSISIRAERTALPAGEATTIRGRAVGAKRGSVVKLQRKVSGSWRTVGKKRVWSTRRYSFRVSPPRGVQRYRVKKARHRGQPAAFSATLRLEVLDLTISAEPTTLLEGESTLVRGKAFAADPGSVVKLQRETSTGWQTVTSRKVWARRTYRFSAAPQEGNQRYRVVKPRQLGQPRVASGSVSIAVVAGPTITTDVLPEAVIGVSYRARLTGDRYGTWTAHPLPAGLLLDPGTGVLSGTPTGPAESVQLTVTLTDSSGYSDTSTIPITVREPSKWTDLSPYCGLHTDGTAWCWGRSADPSGYPTQVPGTWTLLQGHGSTRVGLTSDASGWWWGENTWQRLGDTSVEESDTPLQLSGSWSSLETGTYHTCGVAPDATGWCWGNNAWGELGDGTTTDRGAPVPLPGTWKMLSVGYQTTCGIRTDNSGWCWGRNTSGEIGDGTTSDHARPDPYRLPGEWTFLQTFTSRTCGIKVDATGWCWGDNSYGQVGDGSITEWSAPTQLPGTWRTLSLGASATCGTQPDNTGWCWGRNTFGQLGDGTRTSRPAPVQLPGLWKSLTPPVSATCGIQLDDTGWCWGMNSSGSVGNGTTAETLAPAQLPGTWHSLHSGSTSCGVRIDKTAWCWGENANGQVGDGTTQDRYSPVLLP